MIQLVIAPILFFRARLAQPPRWGEAVAIVTLFVVLSAGVALVTVARVQAALQPAFDAAGARSGAGAQVATVIVTLIALLPVPGLTAAAAVMLDVLFAQSGRAPRLVEFTWLAYAIHLPWVVVVALAMMWVPYPELHVGAALPLDLTAVAVKYHQQLADDALLSTLRVVGMFFTVWVAALQACALRVVGGFSTRGAWAAGITLAALFGVIPWILRA